MSTDFLVSESPTRGYIGNRFGPKPEALLNVVRFFKLMFVLTDALLKLAARSTK